MRPASILDRSRMSLIKASRCRAAPSTRSSGSVSCFKASASSRSISLTPIMALSGVRSSWLILARNCDLCWLAISSWWLFSWISSNKRTFSMAITAWSAKVWISSICFSVNGRKSVAGYLVVHLIELPIDRSHFRFAESGCGLDQGVEDNLQIKSRAANDLQHIGSRGLLLERLLQLVQQSDVVDRDGCLVSKSL